MMGLFVQGMRRGALDTLGIVVPVVAFGVGFGAAAVAAGLPFWLAAAMSGAMFAGASQFAVLDIWKAPLPYVSMAIVVVAVNARHIVLGATLRPRLGGVPKPILYMSAFFLSDANWAATQATTLTGAACCGHLVGGGLTLWIAWSFGTLTGVLLGGLTTDLGRLGLDVVMPAFFAIALFSMAKTSRRDLPPWVISAAVAGGLCLFIPAHYAALAGTAGGGVFAWFASGYES